MVDKPPAPGPGFLTIDLGTTTLAGRVVAADGALLAEARASNPQRALGTDILTRLQRAQEGAGEELQGLLVDGVRGLVRDLLTKAGCSPATVKAVAAAGNPGISHLLCRLPVASLLFPPHRCALQQLTVLTPAELDLGLPVPLQLFPAVTGFIGGDLVAVLFGSRLTNHGFPPHSSPLTPHEIGHQGPALVLDLGTNAELALWTGSHWRVTSAAAGPAFEAGNIACGMPLAPGAVTDVQRSGDRLELVVAGGGRPAGLCGSGLLALLAVARRGGLIDVGGRIVAPDEVDTNLARYLVPDGAGWSLAFHRDARGELRLTQEDVRQFQLAKGAVRAGVEVLLGRSGLAPAEIVAVMLTGAFGAALPKAALEGVAMLPEGMIDKLFPVANGVLDGLADYLRDPHGPERLATLLDTVKPLPLSGTPAFERRFLAALDF